MSSDNLVLIILLVLACILFLYIVFKPQKKQQGGALSFLDHNNIRNDFGYRKVNVRDYNTVNNTDEIYMNMLRTIDSMDNERFTSGRVTNGASNAAIKTELDNILRPLIERHPEGGFEKLASNMRNDDNKRIIRAIMNFYLCIKYTFANSVIVVTKCYSAGTGLVAVFEVTIDGVAYVLKIVRNKYHSISNKLVKMFYNTPDYIETPILTSSEYNKVSLEDQKDIDRIDSIRFPCAWILTKTYYNFITEIDSLPDTKPRNFLNTIATTIACLRSLHNHQYVFTDWKTANIMVNRNENGIRFIPDTVSVILSDLDSFPVERNGLMVYFDLVSSHRERMFPISEEKVEAHYAETYDDVVEVGVLQSINLALGNNGYLLDFNSSIWMFNQIKNHIFGSGIKDLKMFDDTNVLWNATAVDRQYVYANERYQYFFTEYCRQLNVWLNMLSGLRRELSGELLDEFYGVCNGNVIQNPVQERHNIIDVVRRKNLFSEKETKPSPAFDDYDYDPFIVTNYRFVREDS